MSSLISFGECMQIAVSYHRKKVSVAFLFEPGLFGLIGLLMVCAVFNERQMPKRHSSLSIWN